MLTEIRPQNVGLARAQCSVKSQGELVDASARLEMMDEWSKGFTFLATRCSPAYEEERAEIVSTNVCFLLS